VTSVTDELKGAASGAGTSAIDVEAITKAIDLAWHMSLGTSTRADIDARTAKLTGYMNLLRGQCLGEDENRDTLQVLRMVERHLSPENRPTRRTPAHDAFGYLRDSAVFTSTLLSHYQKQDARGDH
jgi:hypothetical protein